ncbi:MAG: hypothetical protein ABIH26_06375 [Candidatus Eisenbacteria bacterium]
MKDHSTIGLLLLAGFFAFGGGCAGDGEPPAPGGPGGGDPAGQDSTLPPGAGMAAETCEKNATIRIGAYAVTNNMHGEFRLAAGDTYEQCVAIDSAGFPVTWRWAVDTDEPYVKGFPQIAFGINPWTQVATTKQLPARVGDLTALLVTHKASVQASGVYNLAFDLWVTEDDTPTQHERTNEIMVWLDGNTPVGNGKVGPVTIGGELYDFYEQQPYEGPLLLLFVAHRHRPSGETDLLEFLHYLEANGYLSPDHYVSIVELGTEMWHGEGTATVTEYSVLLETE